MTSQTAKRPTRKLYELWKAYIKRLNGAVKKATEGIGKPEDWLIPELDFGQFCRFWRSLTPERLAHWASVILPGGYEREQQAIYKKLRRIPDTLPPQVNGTKKGIVYNRGELQEFHDFWNASVRREREALQREFPDIDEEWLPKEMDLIDFLLFWAGQTPEMRIRLVCLISPGGFESMREKIADALTGAQSA